MNRNALLAGVVALLTSGCLGTSIQPGYMGLKYVVLDEPALQKEPRAEGFYFQWPWNEMVSYDVTWQSQDEEVAVLTEDDLHVMTTVTVTFRPKIKELYELHTKLGRTYYADVIRPAFVTLARSEFARHKHNDLAKHSPKIEEQVLSQLTKALRGKPLEIGRVSVKHIKFDAMVTDSISKKLAMEQKAEQKEFELKIASREAEIARAEAQGVSDSVRIRATGEAKAIVIKGKAQGEAQAAIVKTLTTQYLQYKAFDSKTTRYYFVPVGKDGLPLIINAEAAGARRRR